MLAAAGEVGTLIKAYVFYGKEMDNEYLTAQLYEVLTSVHNMAQGFGLTFVEILQANIDKLALRYPSKFNQQDALARQDETGAATPAYVSQDGAEQGPP